MKNTRMGEGYLGEARSKLQLAEVALENEMYPSAFRLSQEAVELSLKGALRIVGVEYPREHDVGLVLEMEADRFPVQFRKKLPELRETSEWLARHRGPALYGDEESGIPPGELFTMETALEALERTREVVKASSALVASLGHN